MPLSNAELSWRRAYSPACRTRCRQRNLRWSRSRSPLWWPLRPSCSRWSWSWSEILRWRLSYFPLSAALISWLEAQREDTYEWDDCEDCLFARYARTLGVQLGQAWCSPHPDGRVAMELYCQIGGGDEGGNQSYVDALARAKYCKERPMLVDLD